MLVLCTEGCVEIFTVKKLIAFILFVLPSFITEAQEQIAAEKDPYKLVKVISQELVQELSKVSAEQVKKQEMKRIVNDVLFPHVDTKYVSYSVLGKYLKKTSKGQRDAFTEAFSNHLVSTYSVALEQFDQQQIEVQPARSDFTNKSKVSIKAMVVDEERPTIDVFFKLRKNKKTGQWLLYDLVAEGISLLHSKRSEFAKMIKEQGVDATTEYLLTSS